MGQIRDVLKDHTQDPEKSMFSGLIDNDIIGPVVIEEIIQLVRST